MNDFATVTAPGAVRIERLLPGPVERLWNYLTDPEKRASWLAGGAMDLRAGGEVEHIFHNSKWDPDGEPAPPKYAAHAQESRMHGRITACDPPRLLSYTWGHGGDEFSEVRMELTPQDDRVRLVLTHSDLRSRDTITSVAGGWHTHLDILAAQLAGRKPEGFWKTHTRLEAEYERRLPVDAAPA